MVVAEALCLQWLVGTHVLESRRAFWAALINSAVHQVISCTLVRSSMLLLDWTLSFDAAFWASKSHWSVSWVVLVLWRKGCVFVIQRGGLTFVVTTGLQNHAGSQVGLCLCNPRGDNVAMC